MSISTRKLYVGNFPWTTTEDEIRELFADYGEVLSVKFEVAEEDQHPHKGYGFVEMSTQREAEEALKKLHDKQYRGRTLKVGAAHPKSMEKQT